MLPPGMFALFVAGAFDNATLAAAQNTTGGTCVSYLQLNGTDHYGITNYDAVDAAHDGQASRTEQSKWRCSAQFSTTPSVPVTHPRPFASWNEALPAAGTCSSLLPRRRLNWVHWEGGL